MNYFKKHFHNQILKYFWKHLSYKSKVFGIGLNKTATSSLGKYFEDLNYYHSSETYTAEKCNRFLNDKNFLYKEVDRFDMHEDWPWPFVYQDLFFKYPNSKFILTLRESPEKWFNSLKNTSDYFAPSQTKKIFYGHSIITEDLKDTLIAQYKNHKKQVLNFFDSNKANDRLYVLNVNNNNKEIEISEFLGIPFDPTIKYPHKNKRLNKLIK